MGGKEEVDGQRWETVRGASSDGNGHVPKPKAWWNISALHALWNCIVSQDSDGYLAEFHQVDIRAEKSVDSEDTEVSLEPGIISRWFSAECQALLGHI